MGVEGERKRLEMAGATGAIEEDYRQGLAAHATRLNKVRLLLCSFLSFVPLSVAWLCVCWHFCSPRN